MSQETSISNLGGGISDEDSKLVDSILNDLNGPSQPQPSQGQPGQPSDEQRMMMKQQEIARQQHMQQQQMQQQQMKQQMQQNIVQSSSPGNILNDLKSESKNILVIVVLSVIMNLDNVNTLFKTQKIFIKEDGDINIQCLILKALIIGVLYYLIKFFLLK